MKTIDFCITKLVDQIGRSLYIFAALMKIGQYGLLRHRLSFLFSHTADPCELYSISRIASFGCGEFKLGLFGGMGTDVKGIPMNQVYLT
jgi:hypothetical protein